MIDRKQKLIERIAHLLAQKEAELKLDNPARSYISDLNNSIAGCERELKFINKNPHGVEMVNGS